MKLVAEGEGAVPLELLGELDGAVRGAGLVALPAFEALLGVTVPVALAVHHVQHVVLHPVIRHRAVVVRAIDVQVIVDADLDGVAFPP
ncbi:hypothetical protein chiPu_0026918 [Chiloscyllium punctatum]|uniref:Uncharacterized protein n=1 Tax=Chiloscyllium punctatum TaxID=137246 RepID=A0A401TKD3_CHIPU|nr:hypothetical protein [Chiloscyllium punctatum]